MSTTVFHRHDDDTVTVNHWDYHLTVSKDLIRLAAPRYIMHREGYISFTVDNGQAVYRVIEEDEDAYALQFVSGEVAPDAD